MRWTILSKKGEVLGAVLKNRGLKTIKERREFLNPKDPEKLTIPIPKKALLRIKKAIKAKEKIVVYGDYDADGICSTAIIWEALFDLKANVLPYIPQREKEGYGLSIEGLKSIEANLVIVVDSGITAHKAVDFANKKGIDVIIIDHHQKPKKPPKAYSIIHTEKLCSAGISYFVAKALGKTSLELAAIATVTDLMPLTGINRSMVKFGIEEIKKTTRVGLKALIEVAGLEKIGTYEIGYIIGPRINASGRVESAMTALRLLCTKDKEKAHILAATLNDINKERQALTEDQTKHANANHVTKEKIIVIDNKDYHQGVIGLVAGKLVEKFYLPAIVIARGEKLSKASARSISGFNIIEAIRTTEKMLVNAGGHPMAAGFTIETAQINNFKLQISNYAKSKITPEMLEKKLRVDCVVDIKDINFDLYQKIQELAPFGMGNPEPVFASEVTGQNIRTVGAEGKHLKLVVDNLDAIGFNLGPLAAKLKIGDKIAIAYNLDSNIFNGRQKLQLKLKDVRLE